jgi:hypothetical protein
MKRFALLLCLSLPAFATLSSAINWDVRPSVGADTNGGGFVSGASGTDFSQQNTKNSGGNNSSTTDAVAVGTTSITSATASFTAAIVGNVVFFSGGTGSITAQWRQVTAFTNGTTIVIDASIAASTGMTMNIGGALNTPTQCNLNAVAGNSCYLKSTASFTETTSTAFNGTNIEPISFIGYTSTHGDGGQFTWTTATNSISLMNFNGGTYNYIFQNLILTTTAGTPGDGLVATSGGTVGAIHLINCSLQGFQIGIFGAFSVVWSFTTMVIENTEIKNSVAQGIFNDGATVILGCYIHNNGGDGVTSDGGTSQVTGPYFIAHSIIKSNGGKGLNLANSGPGTPPNSAYVWATLLNNAIINNTSDGVTLDANVGLNPASLVAWNNIIDSNGGFGINASGTPPIALAMISFLSNAYRANTSGALNNLSPGTGDVTLSADPFVNRAGNNFALNSTAGGGTACKGAGFPGALQIGGTGHIDIGPLQSASGGGGGSNPVGFVSQ